MMRIDRMTVNGDTRARGLPSQKAEGTPDHGGPIDAGGDLASHCGTPIESNMRLPTVQRIRNYWKRRREAARLATLKRAYRSDHPRPASKGIAFIVGCQRSGTTMTGMILDQMMEIDCFPESDRRAFHKARIRPANVIDRLIRDSDAACVIFKPICDSHRVLQLMAEHPPARALWVFRRWRDVVNSAVRMWAEHFKLVIGDLVERRRDWGWRHEGISPDCLEQVKRLYRPESTTDDCMALFWYLRNRIYFDQGLDQTPIVLPVRYESMVTEPVAEFGRICRFLNVPFQPQAVNSIHADSIGKNACSVTDPAIIALCDRIYEQLSQSWASRRN